MRRSHDRLEAATSARTLPQLDIRAEREAEIVDELALQLEAAYDAAIAGGASED